MSTIDRPHTRPARRTDRRSATTHRERGGAAPDRADLQIRNLLDDPALRRAMGLDAPEPAPTPPRPRFDIRRLLHASAA